MKLKKINIRDFNFYYLSDGVHILYVQPHIWDKTRYDVNSVHIPNIKTGTSFGLADGIPEITADIWTKYHAVHAPNWATQADREATVKYKDLNEWLVYKKKFYNEDEIHISEIELPEAEKPYAVENRRMAILRAIYKIQNFMDCDVLGEANRDITEATTAQDVIAGTEYALSAINYRKNDRPDTDIQRIYEDNTAIITNMLAELKAL